MRLVTMTTVLLLATGCATTYNVVSVNTGHEFPAAGRALVKFTCTQGSYLASDPGAA